MKCKICGGYTFYKCHKTPKEKRLINSTSKLLEALKNLVNMANVAGDNENTNIMDDEIKIAEQVIAKVEGK